MANENQENCVFCEILNGVHPISQIYADDHCVGLMVLKPVNFGHAMVIPRDHLPYLADLPAELAGHIFKVAQSIAAAIRASDLPSDGVNLFVADGEAAQQEVFHFHLHIYPRLHTDGFGFKYDDKHFQKLPRSQLDRSASAIRSKMPARISG